MIDDAYRYGRLDRHPRRRRRLRVDLLAMTAAAAIVACALPRFSATHDVPAIPEPAAPATLASQSDPSPERDAWLFDPTPVLGARAQGMRQVVALHSAFEPLAAPPSVVAALVDRQPASPPRPQAVQQTARLVPPVPAQTVPLPVRRPSDLLAARTTAMARLTERPTSPRARAAVQENAEADRSFFDTVFGAKPAAPGPALAYAGVDAEGLGAGLSTSPRRPTAAPQAGGGTAVYDISAARVTLPSGEVLEAHSGLGASMDNPRGVHLRMRGATPPGTYDLTEREALFHGVRALRLNPVGGAGAIYNRNGLLTHTYMLGSSGASNGCISFRNYNRFLQAYLNGEVRRVVVVAGAKQDAFPAIADRLFGR